MKRKNKVLAAFLTGCLIFSLIPTGFINAAQKKEQTASAQFYYVRNNHDAGSNSVDDFGGNIGNGTIIITDLKLSSSNQNYSLNGDYSRVKKWPAGYDNGQVPRGSKVWKSIVSNEYDGYSPALAGKCIKSITMVPYKISYNYDGYHLDSTIIVVAEHSFGEWETTEPTCTTTGKKERVCSTCGQTETETYAALGHDMHTLNDASEPDCTTPGQTASQECSRCGYTVDGVVIDALGHDWTVNVIEPTCLEGGYTEHICGRDNSHNFIDNETEALGHDMIDDAEVAPDCINTGLTEGSHCSRCDYSEDQEEIPALGHDLGNYIIDVEPTCTTPGYKHKECSRCSFVTNPEEIPMLGHDLILDEAVSASCEHTGLTEGNHCSRCDYENAQEVIPVLEPAWGDWVRTVEPTVDEPGTQVRVCTHCNGEVTNHRQEAFVFLEQVEVEKEIEVPVEVEVEKIVEVEKEVIVEVPVEVEVEKIVEVEVEKEVIVEVPSEPEIIEVPVEVEKIIEVPVPSEPEIIEIEKEVPVYIEVPTPVYIEVPVKTEEPEVDIEEEEIVDNEEETIEEIVEEESAEAPSPGPAQIETRYVYVNVPGPVQTVEVERVVEVEVPTAAAAVVDDATDDNNVDEVTIEDEETPLAGGIGDEVDFHCCHIHFLLLIDILCFMIMDLCGMIMRKNKIIKQLEEEKENDL